MVDGYIQEYYQIRSGDTVALNADTGWAAGENTNATIGTGNHFRIRFKVRRIGVGTADQFKPQISFNSGAWTDVDFLGSIASFPCVLCKPSSQFTDGDATSTELLTNTSTYVNGEGVASVIETGNVLTGSYDLDDQETEFEFCFQIMSTFSTPSRDQVQGSDTIEFRIVESDGTVFPNTYTNPTITVSETAGYIGATSCETTSRGVWFDSNDNLYLFAEDSEEGPERAVYKSTNRGATWRVQDDANRPTQTDWESVDIHVLNGIAYIGSQLNNDAYHDQFNLSDAAANQDTWQVTDEAIKTGITRDDQVAALVRRSDGSMVMFFEEVVSTYRRITYRIKNGSWSSDNNLDSTATTHFSFAYIVLGESDLIHIFYQDESNKNLYYKNLNSSDVLSGRDTVSTDVNASSTCDKGIAAVVYFDSSGTERVVVAFKDETNGDIMTSKVDDGGTPSSPVVATDNTVGHNSQGGHHPDADMVVDGTDIYIVSSDETNQEIWLTKSANYGSWDTDVKIVANVEADWVKAILVEPSGGGKYLGIFYENQSNSYGGQMWYTEYELEAPGAALSISIVDSSAYKVPSVKIR